MLKAGIVGLGKMGISHCAILNAHPKVDSLSVCDSSNLVLGTLKKYSKVTTYSDYDQMLDKGDLDLVLVATPTKFHYQMVSKALERRIGVFCEKPFALKVEEAEKMTEAAEERQIVNQVGYHNKFVATFQELKHLLADGVIGQLLHFSGEAYGPVVIRTKGATWRSDKQEGGGCLYDYSSHVINLIQYLLGNPVEVRGTLMKKFFSRNVDDAVYSTLTLDTGLTGTLSVNWSDETYRKMSTSVTIWGSEGKISADSQELKIYLKRENEMYGLKKGWNIKYITDFKQQVWFYLRGEEYSTQIDYFVNHVCSHDLNNINSFASALSTDKVIRLLMNDAEAI